MKHTRLLSCQLLSALRIVHCCNSMTWLSIAEISVVFAFTMPMSKYVTGSTPASESLYELLFHNSLFQLINEPTHIHGNILDLLLTNIDDSINSLEIHPTPLLSSDHFYITFSVAVNCNASNKSSTYYSFNYSSGDYVGLSDYLMHIDFTSCYLSHSVDNIWYSFENIVVNAMNFSFLSKSTIQFNIQFRY